MVANVFLVIIPTRPGSSRPCALAPRSTRGLGAAGKQRSVHNNYMTLPVVLIMISNTIPC